MRLDERNTARWKVKQKESNMLNPISSLQTLHTLLRAQHTHTHTADKAYSQGLLHTQIHTGGQTHKHTQMDGCVQFM